MLRGTRVILRGFQCGVSTKREEHMTTANGQTPAPLAQADHAELAHVQYAEEQAVQQQPEQEIEPPTHQRGPGRRGRKREKQPVQQRPHHVTAPYGKRVSLRGPHAEASGRAAGKCRLFCYSLVTLATSVSEVSPAITFNMPSCRRLRMPSDSAHAPSTLASALSTMSRFKASLTGMIS